MKKQEYLETKKGKKYITPNNKEYIFDYNKVGSKYIFIIEYKGYKMQLKEYEFNTTNIDQLLTCMENSII